MLIKIDMYFIEAIIMPGYTPPPPHSIPEEALPFMKSMTQKEKELHELAIELLGSSYFVETSHAFKSWKKKQTENR